MPKRRAATSAAREEEAARRDAAAFDDMLASFFFFADSINVNCNFPPLFVYPIAGVFRATAMNRGGGGVCFIE
jgi:hypothetical protein